MISTFSDSGSSAAEPGTHIPCPCALGAPAQLPPSHPLPGVRYLEAARRGRRPQGWRKVGIGGAGNRLVRSILRVFRRSMASPGDRPVRAFRPPGRFAPAGGF